MLEILDKRRSHAKVAAWAAHLYADLDARVYDNITIYEAWYAGKIMDIPDVDAVPFAIKIIDRVWEFASGSHNSNNHWSTDEGNRPANGPFQYGPRKCDIRWSTFYRNDVPRDQLQYPVYCVVQVNNAFNNPKELGQQRWVAFPRPQVVFQYYDGHTGDLLYAESIGAVR